MAHQDGALAGFAHDSEGLGEDGVEGGFFGGDALVGIFDALDGGGDALAKLGGLVAELLVLERLNGGLEVVNLLNGRHDALDGAFVAGAKGLTYNCIEQNGILRGALRAKY